MSPASQGGLEVKRYIGSCLISAASGGGGCGAAPAGGGRAAGEPGGGKAVVPLCGLPLISVAARPGAFSRLAMHTQGAPLILAGRYGARRHGQRHQHQHNGQQRPHRTADGSGHAPAQPAPRRHAPNAAPRTAACSAVARAAEGSAEATAGGSARATSSDSLNTASDESSGPSENSLPRIIKPRKRRKKDRKPLVVPAQQSGAAPSPVAAAPAGSNIVTLRPYVPLCFELYEGARPVAGRRREPDKGRPQLQLQAPRKKPPPAESETREELSSQQQQQQVPTPTPSSSPSVCQCRYCDPRGHIWDVRRHCYSPVLTAPARDNVAGYEESPFASIPLFLSAPAAGDGDAADTDDGFFSEDLPTSPSSMSGDAEDPRGGGGSALRRSWSGCSSSSLASGSSLASDPGGHAASAPVAVASQGLQVSTEIVTSPNGHRDLEIRFYSCSPPGQGAAGAAPRSAGTAAAWPASRRDSQGEEEEEEEDEEDGEKLLGGSLWANIQAEADEHGAGALGREVLQLSIRAEV